MAFCTNCGQELADGAKFCANCGKAVTGESTTSQRKTVYEGELHKCPNCGELLEAFTTKCPSCGYELRGAKNSSSVREFAAKLEAIEAGREQRKSNPIKNLYFGQSLTKTDEQKISLIRSFAIPNTKEDLYEFLILSVSNIDVDSYEGRDELINPARKAVSDAWKAQFEQAYQKAKLMFADDPKFTEIEKLHSNTNASINKAKWKTWKLAGIMWGILIVVPVIIITLTLTLTSSAEKEEIQRLENIEIKIEAALEDGDYKLALMNADSLDFNGADSGLERDWEIKRNYWIDKVIEEASKNGVTLERPVDKAEESENSTNSDNASNDLNNQISSNADKNTNTTTENIKPVLAEGVVANSNKYLQIKEVGYTMVGDYLTCIVTITNPSSDTVVKLPAFRVTAYDENGKILGSEERILSVIYPKQDFVDQGTLIEVSKKPHKIDVTVLEPDDYNITPASNMEHPVHKQMVGKNISVNSDKITGEVYNPNDYKIDSAMVTVVFRDANGNIVSSEVEFVDQIPSNGSIPFCISLASDAKTTDKVEVYAYIW